MLYYCAFKLEKLNTVQNKFNVCCKLIQEVFKSRVQLNTVCLNWIHHVLLLNCFKVFSFFSNTVF